MTRLVSHISADERKAIDDCMKELGLSQHKVAIKLSISQSYISHLINGNKLFSPELARKFYELLGKKPSIEFMMDKSHTSGHRNDPLIRSSKKGRTYLWERLYTTYVTGLHEIYQDQKEEVKGNILGDLERLVEKYRGE